MNNRAIIKILKEEIELAVHAIEGSKDTEYSTGWAEGATFALELLEGEAREQQVRNTI